MAEIKQIKVGSTTYDVADARVDTMIPSTSTIGSATKGVYLNNGEITATSYSVAKDVPSNAVFTDTKNTAGTTNNASTKMYLVGATSQAATPQTYSNSNCYIGTDNCLYSGGSKVATGTIPTVGNGTITITQGGTTKGTFTTNQSGSTTIALDAGGTGDVTGPASSVTNRVATFNGTTGKVIKDSGLSVGMEEGLLRISTEYDYLGLDVNGNTAAELYGEFGLSLRSWENVSISSDGGNITLSPDNGNDKKVIVYGKFQATNLTDGTTTKTMTEVLAGGGSPMDTYLQATSASGTVTLSNKSGTRNLQIQPIAERNNLYLKSGSDGTTTIFGGHGVEIDGGDDTINLHTTNGPLLLNTNYSIILTGGGDELGCILLQDQDEYTEISLNNEDPATYNRDITFRSDFGTITLGEIINHIHTCYRGDTTYISMADGTQKLISEVRDGDEVLGIDVRTNEVVTTKVIKVFKTQSVNYYDLYITEDGKTLDINGVEKLVTCSADDNVDHLIETSELQKCIDKDERRRLHHRLITVDENKNIDYTRASAYFKKIMLENFTDAYVIYTVNGTYFVNGICGCHVPKGLYENMHKRHIAIPEAAEKVLQTLISNSSKYDTNLPTAVIGDEAVRDLYINYAAANRTIASKKQYLSSTDYKKTKYDEGVLAEDEWLTVKAARQAARDAINAAEVQRDQYKAELLKINHPISLESGVNRRRYWNEDMAYLMSEPAQAALNAWADENKAKYEEKLAKKAAAAARKALKN